MRDEMTVTELLLTMYPEVAQVQPHLHERTEDGDTGSVERPSAQSRVVIDSLLAEFRFSHAAVIDFPN